MYFRQKPSSWCSCSPAGACGSWCPAAAGIVLEASIREKVSLPILKGKVSLQSPNFGDSESLRQPRFFRGCRPSVVRRTSPFRSSPNSNIQIFEVTPLPGSRAWKRFAANNHASDRAFSAPLFPPARSVRDQLALPESSQFERSFPMVPRKDLRNVHGDNFREAWPRRNRPLGDLSSPTTTPNAPGSNEIVARATSAPPGHVCGVDFGWVKAPCRGRHATRE